MRVAYVSCDPGVPVFGGKGCSVHVQEVVRALRRAGAEVEMFAVRFGGSPPADLQDVPCHPLPAIPDGTRAQRERAAMELDARVGALVFQGDFDLVYERYSLWSCGTLEAARRHGVPGILEVNAPLIEEQQRYREIEHIDEAERIAVRAFAASRTVFAVSAPVADYVRMIVPSANVEVVPNGVDVDRFPPASPDRMKELSIVFAGTLKPWHGVDHLLKACASLFANHANCQLTIVGDGPEGTALRRMAESLGIAARTTFVGAVDPIDVPLLLSKGSIATAPYPFLENFYFSPLKLYEYMAAGLPSVASDIGQVPDIIKHGRNGLLYEPGDDQALCRAIETLLLSPELRGRLGRQARLDARSQHSWDRVAASVLRAGSGKVPG